MKLYKIITDKEALTNDGAFYTDRPLIEVQPRDSGEDTKRLEVARLLGCDATWEAILDELMKCRTLIDAMKEQT